MSTHTAIVRWSRNGAGDFAKGQYSRAHEWAFDGGAVVPASASPHIVPKPWSDEAGVDPEEAFIASLSSCHMLFFLDFARRAGFVADSYVDE
ncbi:MAG: OsmC family peroxiredoxin, partial [Sphingomonas sp.]|nr:OsmC family peroxiredoxin [Sphingomonas sp.]